MNGSGSIQEDLLIQHKWARFYSGGSIVGSIQEDLLIMLGHDVSDT